MNWRVGFHARTGRDGASGRGSDARADSAQNRHQARLNVSPVHGRHCICHDCERHAKRDAQRDAA